MNLADLLAASAYRNPRKVAVIDDHGQATYHELEQMASAVATRLHEHGVEKGDRIAVAMPARHEFVAVYFGILKLGAVVVPLSPLLRGREIGRALNQCRTKYFVAMPCAAYPGAADAILEGLQLSHLRPQCWFSADLSLVDKTITHQPIEALWQSEGSEYRSQRSMANEAAIIGFTSGTTGNPKGAVITHQYEFLNTLQYGSGLGYGEDSIVLSSVGLAAGFGRLVGLSIPLAFGATVRYIDRFNPKDVWHILGYEGVTDIVAVPAMYYALLQVGIQTTAEASNRPAWTERLRTGVYGGAPMSQSLRERLGDALGLKLIQGYGMTEGGSLAITPGSPRNPMPNNELTPLPGIPFRIVDEEDNDVPDGEVGEVITCGPTIMQGYENDPDGSQAKIQQGWLRSGDLARNMGAGRFQLVDRKIATINRGGYKAYPAEIEAHLETHPEIFQAVVLGAQDERLGQEVVAYLMLRAQSTAQESELLAWCKDTLPAHAYPRRIRIVDRFPTTPTGKVDRMQLLPF